MVTAGFILLTGTGNGILGIKKRSLPGPCRIKQNIGGGPRLTLFYIIIALFIIDNIQIALYLRKSEKRLLLKMYTIPSPWLITRRQPIQ